MRYRLPKQFGSTSDQPEIDRIASNVEASISNAEVSSTPVVEVQSTPNEASVILPEETPATNGFHAPTSVNGVTESSSLHMPATFESSAQATDSIEDAQPATPPSDLLLSQPTNSFADSIIPSSVLADAPISSDPSEPSQPVLEAIADPVPQPPTSDLRSPPHADALSASEVAAVEAQKHAEDNAVATDLPAFVEQPIEETSHPVQELREESVKISATGLATPPAQSPPPAPEPAHAELPKSIPSTLNTLPPPLPMALPKEIPVAPAPTPAEPSPMPSTQEMSQDIQQPSGELPQPIVQKPVFTSQVDSAPVQDSVMTEAPPVKVAREREDDSMDVEPLAKRLKTDEPEATFKVPEVPAAASPSPAVSTPVSTPAPDGDDSITPARSAHMKKVISNLKKSNASASFRQPVDYMALKIPTYPDVVKQPMDLSKIDQKLKVDGYSKVSDFVYDFDLIVGNCVLFNGRDHAVTQTAFKMQSSFKNQMSNLPKAQFSEPSKEEKKAAKVKVEPTRTAPPRRPSVSTSSAPAPVAPSPKSATAATPAFAPGPDGIPLIRRDSNMTDGRPKREIKPTKRNSEFASGRPKKKKYELQLKFCQEVIKELTSTRNWVLNQYFMHPVDPVALNIPTYFQIVKKPMDLSTVQSKLDNNAYEKAKDFEDDVRLVFRNCYKFNPDGDYVNQQGHNLEEMFNKKWATKEDWIAAREPPSEPPSEPEDDDDSESDDDDDSEAEREDKISQLQKQIAEMSKQMSEISQGKSKKKKSKSPNATVSKKSKTKNKKDKPKTTFPGLQQKPEKKRAPKPKTLKWVTFAEKQYISNGIGVLPPSRMDEALKLIQNSVPHLQNQSDDAEIELDIEEVPNETLLQLLKMVKKYAGPPPEETEDVSQYSTQSAPPKSKKHKPMSKAAQEAQIQSLKGKLETYAGGPSSPGAVQSIENDDSSDNDDSEESEED